MTRNPDGQRLQTVFRGPGLYLVVNTEGAERGGHHPVCGTHHQRGAEIVYKKVEKGDQHIQHQKTFREGTQTILLGGISPAAG